MANGKTLRERRAKKYIPAPYGGNRPVKYLRRYGSDMPDDVKETVTTLQRYGQRKIDEEATAALTEKQRRKMRAVRQESRYSEPESLVGKYKRGGKVRRTGLAMVHRGERVLTKKQAHKYSRRKRGRRK